MYIFSFLEKFKVINQCAKTNMFAFLTKRILLQQLIYIRRFGCKAAATTTTTTTTSSRLVDFMTCNALNLTLKCNSIFQYYYFTIHFIISIID